ncbi:MAG: formylglycine-generating enzyme family protein [Nitrospira sp.]|nr:MAG: formylglycine-generating enzyme family protein [Nitrospira sp.]
MVKTIPSFVLGRLNASTYQPRTPRRSNSLRPRWMIVLTILLLLQFDIDAMAQLDRLRRSQTLAQPFPVETPMVLISEGPFEMGAAGTQALEDERPRHRVMLDAFMMDVHEVATAQYGTFLTATGRAVPWLWETVSPVLHSDRPVIGVDWPDADAYCRWKGKRLPTEAEWEKAARGVDGRLYPWGNQVPTKDVANFAIGARFSYSQALMPVQSYESGKSPFSVYQMAGNVGEWVSDWYGANYYERSPETNPSGPESGQFKVLRGGSWSDLPKYLLTYGRFKLLPETRNSYTGFRCAKS